MFILTMRATCINTAVRTLHVKTIILFIVMINNLVSITHIVAYSQHQVKTDKSTMINIK